jgi:hypothetical protein
MSRLAFLCLGSLLSIPGGTAAHAYDLRVDPNAARRPELTFAFSEEPQRSLKALADGEIGSGNPRLPRDYGSGMAWYRVTLAAGYTQAPILNAPWPYDEELPQPLHWAWEAETGDVITRLDKGMFRLTFSDSRINWFRDLACRMLSWPDGHSKAPMKCNDGSQRTMQIPGDGVVSVDGIKYARVFHSDITVLPPEETLEEIMARQDLATTAAVPGEGFPEPEPEAASQPETQPEPANVPIPRPRPSNPF